MQLGKCSSVEEHQSAQPHALARPTLAQRLLLPMRHKSVSASKNVETTVYGSSSSSLSVFMTDLY